MFCVEALKEALFKYNPPEIFAMRLGITTNFTLRS
jgi:hypothetical protein